MHRVVGRVGSVTLRLVAETANEDLADDVGVVDEGGVPDDVRSFGLVDAGVDEEVVGGGEGLDEGAKVDVVEGVLGGVLEAKEHGATRGVDQ